MLLPHLVGSHNKWLRFALLIAFVWALYLLTNHLKLFPASHLELWAWEHAIPFYADSVWVYLSYFAIFILAFHLEKDEANLNRFFYGLLLINLLSNLFFVFMPVAYVRTHIPLLLDEGLLTQVCFKLIFLLDSPRNCYPSLHVSIAFFSALHWFLRNHFRFLIFLIWASLICVSTLTTKQHYAVDVMSGLILAAVVHYLVSYRLTLKEG